MPDDSKSKRLVVRLARESEPEGKWLVGSDDSCWFVGATPVEAFTEWAVVNDPESIIVVRVRQPPDSQTQLDRCEFCRRLFNAAR